MTKRWKILVPLDLEQDAQAAVEYAAQAAESLSGDVVLLYVQQERSRSVTWPAFGEGRRVVVQGEPATAICNYADRMEADLILLASRCYGRWFRRSITDAVLRCAQIPVLVADIGRVRNYSPGEKILCVVNLDGGDGRTVDCAVDLGRHLLLPIEFVNVVPETTEELLSRSVENNCPLSEKLARERMEDLSRGVLHPHSTSVVTGSIGRRSEGAHIIVVGKSTAPDVVRRANCPALVVPESLNDRTAQQRYQHRRVKIWHSDACLVRAEHVSLAVC